MVLETILMVILLRFGTKVSKISCWYTVCIGLYQFVSVCISLYKFVSVCISLYQFVSVCIGLYQFVYFSRGRTNIKTCIFTPNSGASSPNNQ